MTLPVVVNTEKDDPNDSNRKLNNGTANYIYIKDFWRFEFAAWNCHDNKKRLYDIQCCQHLFAFYPDSSTHIAFQ